MIDIPIKVTTSENKNPRSVFSHEGPILPANSQSKNAKPAIKTIINKVKLAEVSHQNKEDKKNKIAFKEDNNIRQSVEINGGQ